MKFSLSHLIADMVSYNTGDPSRIQHAMKVYAFSNAIGKEEGLSSEMQLLLESAAVLHDIGIHESERKYGSSEGRYQELEGPPVARKILAKYDLPSDFVDRVCFLVGHHHTYKKIDGLDYQVLVEADFLVNVYDDQRGGNRA